MKEETEMKKWNAPEIAELNLSATAAGKAKPGWVDAVIYDKEKDVNYESYSGNGPANPNPVIITPTE